MHVSTATTSRPARFNQRLTRVLSMIIALTVIAPAPAQSLQVRIEEAIKTSPIAKATIAVSIRDCDASSRPQLAAINSADALIPASNMKLLTTGAALHVLGADFSFRTRMLHEDGTLTIVGDGDPAFGDPALLNTMQVGELDGIDEEQFIDLLIKPITEAGFTQFDELLVDDRIFDRELHHESWPVDQLNTRSFAEVAGLNFHANLINFYLRPVEGSIADARDMRPRAPWLMVDNRTTSKRGPGGQNTAWIHRALDTNRMTIRGNVRSSAVLVPVTVHDAPDFFAKLMANRLRIAGVSIGRAARIDDNAQPAAGETIGPIVTTPLQTVITRCNQASQNLYAEALLKRMAHAVTSQPGSWIAGASVMRQAILDRVGDPNIVNDLVISDGSGLSRENRLAPATMTAWLASFHNDDQLRDPFLSSMAVAGQTGTLKRRFRSTKLHGATVLAKTGFINYVSCLSGFVQMPDGSRRAFSIMMNDLKAAGSVGHAKRLQEKIVGIIAYDMARTSLVRFGDDDR